MGEANVGLTEAAARRVAQLIAAEGNAALMLRLTVSGGGCSGFRYGFTLDATQGEDDVVAEFHGVRLVVDAVSLDLLGGAVVDYVENLMGSAFTVRNPNATATCGCGSSFAA